MPPTSTTSSPDASTGPAPAKHRDRTSKTPRCRRRFPGESVVTGTASPLVQYCYQHMKGCRCRSRAPCPLLEALGANERQTKTLAKGRPARDRLDSVGRAGFQGMTASGWQTAPPHKEVVLVTNSRCIPSPHAFSCASSTAHKSLISERFRAALNLSTAPRKPRLPAPPVTCA